jgi:hypothetical protein
MRYAAAATFVLVIATSVASADILPVGKPCEEFMVGPTGINADIKAGVLAVTRITAGTPADGKLKAGDVLLAVNGTSLEVQDPRHPLGEAINQSEGGDGTMTFAIKRGGEKMDVAIKLEAIGGYGPTWPENCKKSRRIVEQTADFILKCGGPGHTAAKGKSQGGINNYLEGLFLISTGEEKYMASARDFARDDAARPAGSSTWGNGFRGIFLGEYYLATGDKAVLPALKSVCQAAAANQYYGGWGHGGGCGPGYVTGGLVHAAGVQVLTALVLARECGVDVNQHSYDSALTLFYRVAGHGSVAYGDHYPEMWWSSNGKNGGLAAALVLLPDKKFQGGAQILALSETDSYSSHETGHGSPFGNQTWRSIVDVLVPAKFKSGYRLHKDKLAWYYDLSRMPGGGFKTPYFPTYGTIGSAPTYQTGLLAMAYTAQLRNLRITGKPPTKYSVEHKPTEVELRLPYTDFQKADFVEGSDNMGLRPDEIAEKFFALYGPDGKKLPQQAKGCDPDARKQQMPPAWYAKLMGHYDPTVRSWAAHGLGFLGEAAVPEILKALQSSDARLRAAGLEAISGTTGWSPGCTKENITPEMIKEHFLPYIIKPLSDPKAPMWEKRQALMALSKADNQTIAAQTELIRPYLRDPEWWLHVAAFQAVKPLAEDTKLIRPFLKDMMASYDADDHLPSRRWGATDVFKTIIAKNADLRAEVLAGMAKSVNAVQVRDGFKQNIDLNNIYETLRYVDMKKHPQNLIPLLPAMVRIFPKLNGQLGLWLFTGERWGNIGLIKASEVLGKDGWPVVAAMKTMLPELMTRPEKEKRSAKEFQAAIEAVKKAIAAHESKYGEVKLGQHPGH